jgi:hypothetical protein
VDCGKPHCTGVHDNNRYHELCMWARWRKQARDNDYHRSWKGWRKRTAFHYGVPVAQLDEFLALPLDDALRHMKALGKI